MKISKGWTLPKPERVKSKYIWKPLVKIGRNKSDPWGYDRSEEDPDVLIPDVDALELLEEAKKLVKRHTGEEVTAWLVNRSGRKISRQGLLSRIEFENKNQRRASIQRFYERAAKEAAKKAEKYENQVGGQQVRILREDYEVGDED